MGVAEQFNSSSILLKIYSNEVVALTVYSCIGLCVLSGVACVGWVGCVPGGRAAPPYPPCSGGRADGRPHPMNLCSVSEVGCVLLPNPRIPRCSYGQSC